MKCIFGGKLPALNSCVWSNSGVVLPTKHSHIIISIVCLDSSFLSSLLNLFFHILYLWSYHCSFEHINRKHFTDMVTGKQPNVLTWMGVFFIHVARVEQICESGKWSSSVGVWYSPNWHKARFIVWEATSKGKSFTKRTHKLFFNKVIRWTHMTHSKAKVTLNFF